MTTRNGIPKAALQLLVHRWKSDPYSRGKFAEHLEHHADGDRESGLTSRYIIRDGVPGESLTYAEADRLIQFIPRDFYNEEPGCIELNQHYQHSLEQFLAVATHEWDQHVERTNALLGTPAGRIWRA